MKNKVTYRTFYYCVYPEYSKGWTLDREFNGPTALARLTKYLNKSGYLESKNSKKNLKIVRTIEEELTHDDIHSAENCDSSDPRLA